MDSSFQTRRSGKEKRISAPRPSFSKVNPIGGDHTSQTSLDFYNGSKNTSSVDLNPSRGGSTVYVQHSTNQTNKYRIKQPKTYTEKHLDDDDEVLVSKFDYEEFVWWGECLTDELPLLYKQVLEKLKVWKSEYDFELQGFTCFRHKKDKSKRCDVKYIYLPQIWCGKYHPYASVKHKRRACMRTLERLEYLEKITKRSKKWKHRFDYLVKLDLTLPKYVSLEWDNEDTKIRIRKAVQRFLELLHDKLFPNHESQFGVICNHHYWRTKHPFEPHRHIHLNIPNVCYNRSENKFHRFEAYLDEEKVKELKRCWKKALVEYNLWVEEDNEVRENNEDEEERLPDCRLGYIKFSDRHWVIHRLSYCCRKPTEDMVEYLEPEDLEFFDDVKEFANFLINYTPRVVNLGFLTNLKRFGYYSNKSKTMICPICGGEMVALQDKNGLIESLDRPPPHAPKLLRDRKGVWYAVSKCCGSE